jgi:hypothetical protein
MGEVVNGGELVSQFSDAPFWSMWTKVEKSKCVDEAQEQQESE